MLYLNISFDYELFMGKNKVSEKEVLIDPAYKISEMLKEEGVSGTFYADVCCPVRYRQSGENIFPDLFDKQLQDLTLAGHDIQLHLHPNWLKATSIGETVEFDRQWYRLHNWADGNDFSAVEKIVREGIEYLNNTIKPVSPDYRCVAFRAGGFCLQPEKEIASILINSGIRIDSSVSFGRYCDIGGMFSDYRDYPKSKNIYFNGNHSLDEKLLKTDEPALFEVPVGGYSKPFHKIWALKKKNVKLPSTSINGNAMPLPASSKKTANKFMQKLEFALATPVNLSFDIFSAPTLVHLINRIATESGCTKKDFYISAIAHPKCMSDIHIENMRSAIRELKQNPVIEFVNTQDIAKKLNF